MYRKDIAPGLQNIVPEWEPYVKYIITVPCGIANIEVCSMSYWSAGEGIINLLEEVRESITEKVTF